MLENLVTLVQENADPTMIGWMIAQPANVKRLYDTIEDEYTIVKDGVTRDEVRAIEEIAVQQIRIVGDMMIDCPLIPQNAMGAVDEPVEVLYGKLIDTSKLDPVKLIRLYNIIAAIMTMFGKPLPPIPVPAPAV